MGNIRIPLEPDKYYHIYNHAVGRDNLFKCDDNYLFFLKDIDSIFYPLPIHLHIV